jgi:flagellar L-ring protein precursor FlgH
MKTALQSPGSSSFATRLLPPLLLCCCAALLLSPTAQAQSLYVTQPTSIPDEHNRTDAAAPLYTTSMLVVQPPKPRTFTLHDQITIIVDESSQESSDQKTDTKKDYSLTGEVAQFPSINNLLKGQLNNGNSQADPKLSVTGNQKFQGQGTVARTDRFTTKLSATIIDVKPNGLLVLEARRHIKKNEEEKTIVLSGTCRGEDVTKANTVLSSQLADLNLLSEDEGTAKEGASKGWISRILDAVFSF